MKMLSPLRRLLAVTTVLSAPLLACSSGSPAAPQESRTTNMKTATIGIEGMSCAACTARVRKALTSIEGVREVEVNLGERNARVQFDAGKLTTPQLAAAIRDLGYTVGEPVEEP